MFRSRLPAGCAAPCLLLAVPAHAQSTPSPTGDIVVTATRSAQPLADAPASVSVVTARDIADTPARTMDDVLRRVPWVDLPIASTDEQHPTDMIVSMRGLSGIRSLVLLDGVPLNASFFAYVQCGNRGTYRVDGHRAGGRGLWRRGRRGRQPYRRQAIEYRGPIDVPTASTVRNLALSGNADLLADQPGYSVSEKPCSATRSSLSNPPAQ